MMSRHTEPGMLTDLEIKLILDGQDGVPGFGEEAQDDEESQAPPASSHSLPDAGVMHTPNGEQEAPTAKPLTHDSGQGWSIS